MSRWNATAVLGGLLPDGSKGLILGQRLLAIANSLQYGSKLGHQRVRLLHGVELFRHASPLGRGGRRHGPQASHHRRQSFEDQVDLALGIALAYREAKTPESTLPRITERQDHMTRLQ